MSNAPISGLFLKSEKKYKTKAAQEYRRHLAKLMHEGATNLKSPSLDASDSKEAIWDVAGGLDSLMLSVSNSHLSSFSGSKEAMSSAAAAAPEPEHVFPAVTANTPPAAAISPHPSIGSLSVVEVDAAVVGDGGTSRTATPFSGSSSFAPKKSSLASKKGIGARKLVDSSSLDVKMDSFEVVEKNVAKAAQEDEDHKLALKLQTSESGSGSSRLAAVYQDSESLYRAPSVASSSSMYSSARSGSTSAASISNSAGESYQARERFSSSKSISSDQFFGRDEEDSAAARTRLQEYSHATAISSDMLNRGSGSGSRVPAGMTSQGGTSSSTSNGDVGLGKLKESVRDFFARSF